MEEEFSKIGLYKHNADSYRKVRSAYSSGENTVAILQATGTGKTYQALQLIYDNPDKKTLFLCPNNSIIEHIKKTIEDNPNLDMERDFPNLTFMTYQGLAAMDDEEIEKYETDLIVMDEFHHIGAPVWGEKINKLVTSHPNAWKFGMSAYSVRRRGTIYERDMALPGGNEIFSDKVVTRYDLADAMVDGVLPIPTFMSTYLDIEEKLDKLSSKISSIKDEKFKEELEKDLIKAKRLLPKSSSIQQLLIDALNPDGKYIYFCPSGKTVSMDNGEMEPDEEENIPTERLIDTHISLIKNILESLGLLEDINYRIYKTTSYMEDSGEEARRQFYEDKEDIMRIMFNINQYGEGVHAPEVTGIIMSRATNSDIVAFEQIGRTLSVDDSKAKYEKYSLEDLINEASNRNIYIDEIVSKNLNKEELRKVLIDRLVSPYIIDLAGNIKFIKELEDNIKSKVEKKIQRHEQVSPAALALYNGEFTILETNNGKLNKELEDIKSKIKIDKISEFIERLNTGDTDALYYYTESTFSNGDPYKYYYSTMKSKILDRLFNDHKYDYGYETAKKLIYYKENYGLPEKIADFIDLLNHGNFEVTKDGNNYEFPNGDKIGNFWYYHREDIKHELETNPIYNEGYDTAKKIVEQKYFELTLVVVEHKIKEFLDILVTGDTGVLTYRNTYTFSNGSPMAQFISMYKDRIIDYIGKHPEYAKCLDYIKERDYNNDKNNRIREFLTILNDNHPEILSVTNKYVFKNGQAVTKFFSDKSTKERIKYELYNNPEYASFDTARRLIEEYEYWNDPTNRVKEFIELVNTGHLEALNVKNGLTFRDGVSVNSYFAGTKDRVIEMLNTKEYEVGYEYAKKAIADYLYNNDIRYRVHDFIEMINTGTEDPLNTGKKVKFKNGDLTCTFWIRHRYKILMFLECDPKYKEGYDTAKTILSEYEKKHGDTSKKKLATVCRIPYSEIMDIPISELWAKIEYLKSIKEPYVNEHGIHEIFNMSDKNMQKRYNVSLEELINTYCLKRER